MNCKYIGLILVLFEIGILSNAQWRQRPRTTKKPKTTTVGGRWRPRPKPTPYKPKTRTPAYRRTTRKPTRRVPVTPPEYIYPVKRRLPGDTSQVQRPTWVHCRNSHTVDNDRTWVYLQSPGYPDAQLTQFQCTWIISAEPGMKIRLSFEDLELSPGIGAGRCGSQFVEVIDLMEGMAQFRGCGDKLPGDYVSLGNKLRLDIQCDKNDQFYRGFRAAVRAEPGNVKSGTRAKSILFHGEPTKATPLRLTRPPNLFPKAQQQFPGMQPPSAAPSLRNTPPTEDPFSSEDFDRYFGENNVAPGLYDKNKGKIAKKQSSLSEDTQMYLLIASAVFVLLLALMGIYFRKVILEIYASLEKCITGKKEDERKDGKEKKYSREMSAYNPYDSDVHSMYESNMSIPGLVSKEGSIISDLDRLSRPGSVRSNISRRRSVTFADHKTEEKIIPPNGSSLEASSKFSSLDSGLNSMSTANTNEVEPIYESSDTLSISSGVSLKERLSKRSTTTASQDSSSSVHPPSASETLSKDAAPQSKTASAEDEANNTLSHIDTNQQQLDASLLLQQILSGSAATNLPNLLAATDSGVQLSITDGEVASSTEVKAESGELKRAPSVAVIPVDGNTIKRIVTQNGEIEKVTSSRSSDDPVGSNS